MSLVRFAKAVINFDNLESIRILPGATGFDVIVTGASGTLYTENHPDLAAARQRLMGLVKAWSWYLTTEIRPGLHQTIIDNLTKDS